MSVETLQSLVWWGLAMYGVSAVAVALIIAEICAKHRLDMNAIRNAIETDTETINSLNALLIERNRKAAQWKDIAREAVKLLELHE